MAGIRRQARIAALQALYELDCTKHKVEEALARLRAGETLAQEARSFSEELVKGVLQNKSELDALIKKFAPAGARNFEVSGCTASTYPLSQTPYNTAGKAGQGVVARSYNGDRITAARQSTYFVHSPGTILGNNTARPANPRQQVCR